ncbi:MAG: Flp pilus assembly complex ATPase component TadA [Candidatus Synoicihabitans palmerolidicus]|nr:Flp pilus assembly complex ATPase component TadA [Candidatus Synoicihabitans palmerolidicus]
MALGKIQTQIVGALQDAGRLTEEQRRLSAENPEELTGEQLDKLLLEEYHITPFQLQVAQSKAFNLPTYNVARSRIHPGTFERIPQEFCEEHLVFPVGDVGELLLLVVANAFDLTLAAKIQEMTVKQIVRMLGRASAIREKFKKDQNQPTDFADVVSAIGMEFGGEGDGGKDELTDEESGSIIDLANRILEDAYFAGTSAIHIEPWEVEVIVRYRIDGVCQEKLRLPGKVGPALIARLKIMCNLDIVERRMPQDGRIVFKQYTRKGLDVDLRVSTAPLNHGEGVVMSILDKQKSTLPMNALGV